MSTLPSLDSVVISHNDISSSALCRRALDEICSSHKMLGALIVRLDSAEDDIEALATSAVPIEALNGSERPHLRAVIDDCFAKHPKDHIHNIGHLALGNIAKRIARWKEGTQRVVFVPRRLGQSINVFLGFISPSANKFELSDEFKAQVERTIALVDLRLSVEASSSQISAIQDFVREVGHDFASSVQTIIAKVRNLHDGRIPESAVPKKLKEIEAEIRSAYGLADQLGITLDPAYEMRCHEEVSLKDSIKAAIEQVEAEAAERKLTINVHYGQGEMMIGGDRLAIQTCWMHILLNAIKYSFGGGAINVAAIRDGEDVKVTVENRGHPLPPGDNRKRIWDFGFRGEQARELHVNGSGVGLFTARKIVLAHHGHISAMSGADKRIAFVVTIPLWEKLKKKLRFLI